MSDKFEWVDFPQGQAQFCGSIRGTDELGHNTFAIRFLGRTFYGEFEYSQCLNASASTITIKMFGYSDKTNLGNTSKGSRFHFNQSDVKAISDMIIQLFLRKSSKPFPLHKLLDFTGSIIFADDWIQITSI